MAHLSESDMDGKGRCIYNVMPYEKRIRELNIIRGIFTCGPGNLEFYYEGDIDSSRKLVYMGADINIVDSDGWSPLFMAVYSRHADSVKFLMNANANINLHDSEGRSPITLAVEILDEKIVSILLESEATYVDADTFKETIFHHFDIDLIEKMLARFLRDRKEVDMEWSDCQEWPWAIYSVGEHVRNRRLIAMLVKAFPGFKNETTEEDGDGITCYDFIKYIFAKERVPGRYAREILNILDNDPSLNHSSSE